MQGTRNTQLHIFACKRLINYSGTFKRANCLTPSYESVRIVMRSCKLATLLKSYRTSLNKRQGSYLKLGLKRGRLLEGGHLIEGSVPWSHYKTLKSQMYRYASMFINYRLSHHPSRSSSSMIYGSSHSPCIPTIRSCFYLRKRASGEGDLIRGGGGACMMLWSKGRALIGACALIIRRNAVMVVSVFCYFICFFFTVEK